MAFNARRTVTEDGITVIGAPRTTLRDFYYVFLKVRWSIAVGVIVAVYLALNAIFAAAYVATGGIANARPDSFYDAFCFSVETMGTVGYGWMYPLSAGANAVMICETVTSLIITAVATGLVFAKFSRSSARVVFSKYAVVGPMDGVPTLMLRVGNERGNQILEATVRVALVRTEITKEKLKFYRMYDLRLSRERSPAMARSWTVLHAIDRDSPLFGATPETIVRDEVEIIVNIVGTDDTSLQAVHARKRYDDHEIVWGARHADVLTETEDGSIVMDVRRFHDIHPTEPFEGFPYPAASPSGRAPTSS
jgi:inward rectifier potassium channel